MTAAAVSTDPNYSGANAADVRGDATPTTTRAGITVTPTTGADDDRSGRDGDVHGGAQYAADGGRDDCAELERHDGRHGQPGEPRFTTANWNVAQTVTVTGVDDAVVDGPIAYTIVTAAAVSTDPNYNRRERGRRRGDAIPTTTRRGSR